MIKKFSNFESTQAYTDGQALPQGGYVCRIISSKVEESNYGQYIKMAVDIAEGEFKDFYKKRYDSNTNEDKKWPGVFLVNVPLDDGSQNDEWTKRRFKTFTNALEDSNSGYAFDWDETKFKGKLIGLVTRKEPWENDGTLNWVNRLFSTYSVEDIRAGKFKYPKDKAYSGSLGGASSDFVAVPDNAEEDIPF